MIPIIVIITFRKQISFLFPVLLLFFTFMSYYLFVIRIQPTQLFLVLLLQPRRLNMVSWPWECFRVNYKWFYIILLSVRIICDVILSMRHEIEATSILVLLLYSIFFIIKKVSRFNFYHNIITIFAPSLVHLSQITTTTKTKLSIKRMTYNYNNDHGQVRFSTVMTLLPNFCSF